MTSLNATARACRPQQLPHARPQRHRRDRGGQGETRRRAEGRRRCLPAQAQPDVGARQQASTEVGKAAAHNGVPFVARVYQLASDFGMRWGCTHPAQDFAVPVGTAVKAISAGTVIFAGGQGGSWYQGRAPVVERDCLLARPQQRTARDQGREPRSRRGRLVVRQHAQLDRLPRPPRDASPQRRCCRCDLMAQSAGRHALRRVTLCDPAVALGGVAKSWTADLPSPCCNLGPDSNPVALHRRAQHQPQSLRTSARWEPPRRDTT